MPRPGPPPPLPLLLLLPALGLPHRCVRLSLGEVVALAAWPAARRCSCWPWCCLAAAVLLMNQDPGACPWLQQRTAWASAHVVGPMQPAANLTNPTANSGRTVYSGPPCTPSAMQDEPAHGTQARRSVRTCCLWRSEPLTRLLGQLLQLVGATLHLRQVLALRLTRRDDGHLRHTVCGPGRPTRRRREGRQAAAHRVSGRLRARRSRA